MTKNLNDNLKEFIEKGKDAAYTLKFVPGVVRDAVGGAAKQWWKNYVTPIKLSPKQYEYGQKRQKEFNEQIMERMKGK